MQIQAVYPTHEHEQAARAVVDFFAASHAMKLLSATLDGIVIARPEPSEGQPQHLCLDAGYDYPAKREEAENHHYLPHIRSRGQE